MSPLAALSPGLIARARADQVATIYERFHLTSWAMGLGALLFCIVLRHEVAWSLMALWCALIAVNQAWRAALVRAWQRARPGIAASPRWGRYWAIGSTLAGGLWGFAGVAMFPVSDAYQALLIVCLFGVVLGSLNLTAQYRPSFYGFVLAALVPLIARVALVGDQVHFYIAFVMSVVLGALIGFGQRINDVLTHSLAIRYQNAELIDELKDRTRSALEARAGAESANRAKSQLLAAASHDLRQPLHALSLYVGALTARARGAEWQPLLASVQSAIDALESQFAQLLDLSRLEAGALAPELTAVPLEPLLSRLGAEFAAQAEARQLVLKVVPTRICVRTDPAMLERIVRNLIANAVRYTPSGGVVVGARRCAARVAIDVVDTGIGIAAEHRERIFDEFYQVRAGAPGAPRRQGMGLGLAIVRRFADLLGHEIRVDSTPGTGSRFRILAPRASVEAPATSTRVFRARTSVRNVGSLKGSVVAILDDDLGALEAMRSLYAAWGAIPAAASDIEALLSRVGELARYPDLVVADLHLANGDGVNAVLRLRDELGTPIPALIVSGDTASSAAQYVAESGLTLLAKPVAAATLRSVSCAMLARAESVLA
jgi:signal transduction histidine kinase/CheY-like chemotaxis protein